MFNKRKMPIVTSIMASKMMDTFEGIKPNKIESIVSFAKPSAGLISGKNFKNPNHR
jgi:hypothetical protein